jgi:hypothetical protein
MLAAALVLTGQGIQCRPDTAAQILERTRDAVGYANIAKHPSGIEVKGTVDLAALNCSYSLIFSGDLACVQRIDGPLTRTAAIDGEVVWISDIGGVTRRAVNADRENEEIGLLLANYGYLGTASPFIFHADEAAATPESAALGFSLKDGRARGTLWIDRATWLPSSCTFGVGDLTTSVKLGGYKEFAGIKFPGEVVTKGPSGMEVTFRTESIGEAPVFFRSPYQMVDAPPTGTTFDGAVPPALEVVKAPTGHILVHPLVNGKDVGWFIFDTGAGSLILSTPVAKEMGVGIFGKVPANGVGGKTSGGFCRPDSLTLGPVTMDRPLMVTLDLAFLDQYMGRRVAGLVGYDLLARVVARIDMETPAVSLFDPAAYKEEGLKWQELVVDQRLPQVRASFEGHTGLFRLDTGAAQLAVSMHAPAVKELKLLEGRKTVNSLAGGVGGAVPIKRGNLAWFELAGKRTEDVLADFAETEKGAFADPYALGNIGGVLLKPFIIVTDYRGGRIAFVGR